MFYQNASFPIENELYPLWAQIEGSLTTKYIMMPCQPRQVSEDDNTFIEYNEYNKDI
jgi:hypothetical protein